MTTTINPKTNIDSAHTLSNDQIAFYRDNGFIKLKNVLSNDVIEYYQREISKQVQERSGNALPMDQRNTYQKAFLQVSNIWTKNEVVKEFVMGKRLARIASELMEVQGVRLYHDQALYKEPGGGITPWHADQYYWPVSSDKTITAWIPLQETPLELGPLAFCPKSHKLAYGRDLKISDESEIKLQDALKKFPIEESRFDLGEVSFHSGWTFHRAGPNRSNRPREVMTIIYMDQDMRLIKAKNNNHELDRAKFCPGIEVGEIINSHLNPILYSKDEELN
jgi:ectoine hydroxylase-related dioxygenase (phytanoyl-CoA dioxygenase family)